MDLIGKEIFGYKVTKILGSGSFGSVYQVEKNNKIDNTIRALKVIHYPDKAEYRNVLNSMGGNKENTKAYFERALEQVLDEVRVFAMLSKQDNHNIVQYYESDVQEEPEIHQYTIYILMECLTPLSDWIEDNTLTLKDVCNIAKSIGMALNICAGQNVMHRDIKMDNVFVSKDRKFKLGDFGIAKHTDGVSRTNSIKGTPYYIAPEVYLGREEYDGSVDLYSLGILIYYLLNHMRFPFFPKYPLEFTKEAEDAAFAARMRGEIPPPPDMAPPELAAVIQKAINPRINRYGHAKDFLQELEEAIAKIPLQQLNYKVLEMNASQGQFTQQNSPDTSFDETVVLSTPKQSIRQQNHTYDETVVLAAGSQTDFISPRREEGKGEKQKQQGKVQKKKTGKGVLLVLLIIIVFGIGISAAWVVVKKDNRFLKTNKNQTEQSITQKQEETTQLTTTQRITTQAETTQATTQQITTQATTTAPTTKDNKISIEDVVGKKYEDAKKILEKAGAKVKKKEKYDNKIKKGRVISQSVKSGKKVEKGSSITLYVSKGEEETTAYVEPTTQYIPPTTQYVPPTTTKGAEPTTKYIPPTTTKAPQEKDTTKPLVIFE